MPLFWISLAFLSGILLADVVYLPGWAWLVLVAALLALAGLSYIPMPFRDKLAWLRRGLPVAGVGPAALLVALSLGGTRLELARPPLGPDHIAHRNGQGAVTLQGVIAAPPDIRDQVVGLRIRAELVSPAGQSDAAPGLPARGTVLVWAAPGGAWQYGDRVQVTGELEAPEAGEESLSYRDYLARQRIYSRMAFGRVTLIERSQGNPLLAAAFALRQRALQAIDRLLPAPESALLAGILLGEEQGIPAELQRAFQASGTSHLIAISGYNMTVLAGLLMVVFGRLLGRNKGTLAAVVGIAFYTVLVGGQPSAVRAAIMGGFGLFGRLIGRPSSGLNAGLNALLIAAGLMCLFDPQSLWDVGFQLSFFATLGLILYAEPMKAWSARWLERLAGPRQPPPGPVQPGTAQPGAVRLGLARPGFARQIVEGLGEGLVFTLAAQITTLPLLATYFGQVSPAAFLANPVVLPAQPPLMVLGGLAALLGSIALPLGQPFAWLTWPFLAFTIRAAELFGSLPHAAFSLLSPTSPAAAAVLLVLYYLVLFGLTWGRRAFSLAWTRLAAWTGGWRPNAILVVLAAAACLAWRAAFDASDGRLHLTLLGSGAGSGTSSLLVQTPGGRYLLVSGGGVGDELSASLGRRLPLLRPELDLLLITPGGSAELDSLAALVERLPVRQAVWAAPAASSRAARRLQDSLIRAGSDFLPVRAGSSFDLGDGARLALLSTGPEGACLLVEWGAFRALLVPEACGELPAGPVTALVMGGGGDADAGLAGQLDALRPQVILSGDAGIDAEILEAPFSPDVGTVLNTGRNGWIQVSTDGERLWVEVERR
jgi:competence protein ComEC